MGNKLSLQGDEHRNEMVGLRQQLADHEERIQRLEKLVKEVFKFKKRFRHG